MIQDVAAIVAVLVVLVPLFGYICVACYKSFKAFKMVTAIAEQFETNGGSTLSDRISAITTKLDVLMVLNDVSLNLLPYSVFKSDSFGHINWVSRRLPHELDLEASDALGLGWLSAVAEEDRRTVRQAWLEAIQDSRAVNIEFFLLDGSLCILEALPVKSTRGLEGMLGVFRLSRRHTYENQ